MTRVVSMSERQSGQCPHCGAPLQALALPENGGWDSPYHWACFNDACPYFVRGWDWMMERYRVKVSYRYRVDPITEKDSPLPVWSPTALRDRILTGEELAKLITHPDPRDGARSPRGVTS